MISKARLKEQLVNLPEEFTIDELVGKLVFMEKVESGLQDSVNGYKISEEQLEREMKTWFR